MLVPLNTVEQESWTKIVMNFLFLQLKMNPSMQFVILPSTKENFHLSSRFKESLSQLMNNIYESNTH